MARRETVKQYHERQRRGDEEALFGKKSKEEVNHPWVVLPHESIDMLRSVIEGIIRPVIELEVAKAFQELGTGLQQVNINKSPMEDLIADPGTLDEQLRRALSTRDYSRAIRWSYDLDHKLCRKVLIGYRKGYSKSQVHEIYAHQNGFTPKSVQLRWVELQRYLKNIKITVEEIVNEEIEE